MTQFGQAGHAKDYTPIPLSEMAKRYAGDGRRINRRIPYRGRLAPAPTVLFHTLIT